MLIKLNLQRFAAPIGVSLNVTLDSGIESIHMTTPDDVNTTITTNGSYGSLNNTITTFVVTLKNGYIMDKMMVGTSEVTATSENTYEYTFNTDEIAVSFTSKQSGSGETWLLNESLGMDTLSKTNVTFKSNNENFVGIAYSTSSMGPQTLWYYKNDTEYVVACEYGTYSNQAFRTITFATPPTGDLLTWLQSNGTKQTAPSTSQVSIDLTSLSGWSNVSSGEHSLQIQAKANGFATSEKSTAISFTKSADKTSLKWKFNGTKAFIPQRSYDNSFEIDYDVYNNDNLVESNLHYVYFNDNYTYMAFGSSGYWDTTNNQYGSGNIILFKTEPTGFLLQFLQEHCEALD